MIEDWGWSVEARIPFKSLRYKAGKGRSWGFNAARNIDRLNREFDSWVPLPRDKPGFINKFGKITGLDDIEAAHTLEVIPTLTLKETGKRIAQNDFSNSPVQPDFGFTAKYTITPNVTLDMAYNPDFADTEADAPVVEANQRFPIFYPEKRPFFLEGVEIFQTPIQAVYTRRIENPDVAVKLSGKIGKNSFGVFGAIDSPLSSINNDKTYVAVARLKRDFGKESNIGFLATTYHYPRQHDNPVSFDNTVAGFDTRWKISTKSEFDAQILASASQNYFYNPFTDTEKYRTAYGINYSYSYSYDSKNFNWGLNGNGVTKNYRSDVGFTGQTNTMSNTILVGYNADPKPKASVIRKSIYQNFSVSNDFYGRLQNWAATTNVNFGLKGNASIGGGVSVGFSKIYEDEFGVSRKANNTGTFFGNAYRSTHYGGVFAFFSKSFNKRFSMSAGFNLFPNSFDYDFGTNEKFPRVSPAYLKLGASALEDPGTGTDLRYNAGVSLKPTDKFTLGVSYRRSSLVRDDTSLASFDSNIFSLRSTYQFSKFVNFKAILDYNTLSGRIGGQYTFGWTPSPGKSLYIGYNDAAIFKGYVFGKFQPAYLQTSRTFFVKISYLFRKSF